uniref:Uncharacterized protein n=1 Tax=Timema bartmani TaxID=61472 RepID=A0A7R9F1J4_9NEOP|nr:unnamed protein product [Timema bartmani]
MKKSHQGKEEKCGKNPMHKDSGKLFRKHHPRYSRSRLSHDLPVIGSLVYCKSSALYFAATDAEEKDETPEQNETDDNPDNDLEEIVEMFPSIPGFSEYDRADTESWLQNDIDDPGYQIMNEDEIVNYLQDSDEMSDKEDECGKILSENESGPTCLIESRVKRLTKQVTWNTKSIAKAIPAYRANALTAGMSDKAPANKYSFQEAAITSLSNGSKINCEIKKQQDSEVLVRSMEGPTMARILATCSE